MDNNDFHTFSEYMKKEDNLLTASMEDYLEMIYRLSKCNGFTRIHELSDSLNVQPPSATKMVQRLAELKLLKYEKYGVILLEEEGRKVGKALLERHNIIEDFFKLIGVPEENILEETEKMEHTISKTTVGKLQGFIAYMKDNEDIYAKIKEYIQNREL